MNGPLPAVCGAGLNIKSLTADRPPRANFKNNSENGELNGEVNRECGRN